MRKAIIKSIFLYAIIFLDDFNKTEETREQIDPDPVVQSEQSVNDNSIDKIAIGIPGSLSNQPPVTPNTEQENNDNKKHIREE